MLCFRGTDVIMLHTDWHAVMLEFAVFVLVGDVAALPEGSTPHIDRCNVPRQFLITGC